MNYKHDWDNNIHIFNPFMNFVHSYKDMSHLQALIQFMASFRLIIFRAAALAMCKFCLAFQSLNLCLLSLLFPSSPWLFIILVQFLSCFQVLRPQ